MAEGLRIPITVDFKNSLQKLNEIKKAVGDFAAGADKSLGILGAVGPQAATAVNSISAAVNPLKDLIDKTALSIKLFASGAIQIGDVIPFFEELIAKTGGLDQALEQLKDLPNFDEFLKGIDEGVQAFEELGQISVPNLNAKNVITFEQELRRARETARRTVEEFGKFSPQAQNAAQQVKDLEKVIQDTNNITKSGDLAGKFALAGKAIQGAAAGFQTITALQAVFGKESKKTEEALKKVQAVMALTQGIEGVLAGVEAFKTLGIAALGALKGISKGIAATGIGLFVVALGTVVAYWDDIKKAVDEAGQSQKRFNGYRQDLIDINKNANSAAADEISKLKILYQVTQDQTVSLKQRNRAVDELQKLYPSYFGNLTNEAILAGNAKTAYDNLTRSIILKARAEAGQKKVAELFEDEDYQDALKKVEDVNKAIANVSKQGFRAAGGLATQFNIPVAFQNLTPANKEFEGFFKTFQTNAKKYIKEAENTVTDFDNRAKNIINSYGAESLVDSIIGDGEKPKETLKEVKETISGLKGQPIEIPLRLTRLEELNERLKELKDKQLKVNTALEFQQIQGQIDAVQGEIDGITSVKPLTAPVFVRTVLLPPEPEGIKNLANARESILNDQAAFQEKYTALVESGLEDAFEAFGTAIGEGEDPFAALGKSIGLSLANFASQLGKDLVGLGKLFAALQATLKGLGPGAKIAIGLALIAFGAAVKAAIGKRGKEQGFASGGYIDGPGTDTSDSIPARLSKGEYVIRARSVRRYGKSIMDRINKGEVPLASLARAVDPSRAIVNRSANELQDLLKTRSRAIVNRGEVIELFSDGGLVGESRGVSRAIVNRSMPDFIPYDFSRAIVNRPAPNVPQSTEPQIIATTKVSGQDLKIILERADRRYSNVT